MASESLHLFRTDVAHDSEDIFNKIYDGDVLPELSRVRGVLRVTRYRNTVPTDPRYLTIHQIASPRVPRSREWAAVHRRKPWGQGIRPHTMNRSEAVYVQVSAHAGLTYATSYLFCVMLDVEPHKEALLNDLYDSEHIPLLLDVPGVKNAVRYRTTAKGYPRYLAIYEVEHPDVPRSTAWVTAADTGRWDPEVRPYTYNKRFVSYESLPRA